MVAVNVDRVPRPFRSCRWHLRGPCGGLDYLGPDASQPLVQLALRLQVCHKAAD